MNLPRHGALLAVLAVGVAIRVVLMVSYTPAYLSYPDTWGYVVAAKGPLFLHDWIRPAGYPAMLAVLHAVWNSLTFVVVVQHLLGLATAVVMYATLLRAGASRWVAVLPAAVVALTVDGILYEHALLSETPFALLIALALYAGVRALEPGASVGWAVAAGALLAVATAFRGAALFAIPVFAVVMLLRQGGAAARIRGAVAVAAAAGALLLAYAALQDTQNGHFGLVQGGGWAAYSRAAPFADCRVFTPPKGTESLCDPRDARDRPGSDFYAWDARSPAVKAFKGPPFHSAAVGAFGKAAIKAQPKAYVQAVATDLWRYVDSDAGPDRYANGDTPAQLSLARRRLKAERPNVPAVEALYGDVEIRTTGAVSVLADLQRIVRVHGALVLLALLLSLAGAVLARGQRRAAILLLAGTAVVPIVLASATTVYNWRYMVPLLPALTGAGAFGAQLIAARVRARPGR